WRAESVAAGERVQSVEQEHGDRSQPAVQCDLRVADGDSAASPRRIQRVVLVLEGASTVTSWRRLRPTLIESRPLWIEPDGGWLRLWRQASVTQRRHSRLACRGTIFHNPTGQPATGVNCRLPSRSGRRSRLWSARRTGRFT